MTTTRTYLVDGMSCDHCVHAITGEVGRLPGVHEVTVDIGTRTVAVTGSGVDDASVRAAIDEAGYAVVA